MKTYSPESYRRIIELALERGYRFVGFREPRGGDRRIYLRHDVHATFSPALRIAEINHSLGVRGTFFLLLRSQTYNLLGDWALARARRLAELGQGVGLHYIAPTSLPSGDAELADLMRADLELLRRNLPITEPVLSFHNPTPELLRRALALEVPGLVNAYSSHFVKEVAYYSDSNMRHSVPDLEKVIDERRHEALQLLFHPDHWVPGGADMSDVLAAQWEHVLRELDDEMRSNSVYAKLLPAGLPEEVVKSFSAHWRRAAGSR